MPKYSVSEVIDIINSLTDEEKIILQTQLPTVLNFSKNSSSNLHAQTQQSQSVGNITMGSSNALEMNQISAEGEIELQKITQAGQGNKPNLRQALELLELLKGEVNQTEELNKLEKKTVASTIEVVEEEIKKETPDKDLITQAIEALEKGLGGIERLAVPTIRVAKLIASALFL